MDFTDEALRYLARRMGRSERVSREAMEALFVPMIRVALRTGRGQPRLLDWVARHLPAVADSPDRTEPIDPEWAAPRMARMLCSQMLQHVQVEPAWRGSGETVVGR